MDLKWLMFDHCYLKQIYLLMILVLCVLRAVSLILPILMVKKASLCIVGIRFKILLKILRIWKHVICCCMDVCHLPLNFRNSNLLLLVKWWLISSSLIFIKGSKVQHIPWPLWLVLLELCLHSCILTMIYLIPMIDNKWLLNSLPKCQH